MKEAGGVRPIVLITGATGALGPAVTRAFNAASWNIRTLSRKPPAPGAPAASHPHISAEIDDFDALCRAMDGADAVIHMAALLHVFDRSASLDEYRRVNVGGTAAVMAAARERSVRRVVALSSIAVYGPHAEMVDEHTPPAPDTPYGRSKLEAEREVLEMAAAGGGRLGAVLRLAAVYGPSVKGNYERLVQALARRRFVPVGSGGNTRTIVFEDDAAQAILLAATRPAAAGELFNVTDGEIHTVAEISAAIARALGRRPPRLAVPPRLAFLCVNAAEALFGLAGRRSPVTKSTLEKYLENVAVSGQRIRERLEFEPQWPLANGWQHTVAQLRREGRL